MTYYTYILKSLSNSRYYIGSCQDLEIRLWQHNNGRARFTKSGIPWEVVYFETFEDRSGAYLREKQIKSYKGGEAFKKLVIR